MAISPEYLPIPCSSLRVKKADGNFEEQEIKFATTTDLIDDLTGSGENAYPSLTNSLSQIKARKCIAAGCSSGAQYSLSANLPFRKIPLDIDYSEGIYYIAGDGQPQPAPTPSLEESFIEYLSFSEDGGVVCNRNGYVLISGSAYINSNGTTSPYAHGVYIYRKPVGSQYDTSGDALAGNPDSLEEPLYEVMSTYSSRTVSQATSSSGSRILHVNAGDTLYLAVRGTGTCSSGHPHTLLNVAYMSLD